MTATRNHRQAGRQAGRLSLILVLGLGAAALAQGIPSVGDTTAPPPNLPGHALIVGPHEVVNPANGSVALSFPVAMPPGRQWTLPFSFFYSSNGQRYVSNAGPGNIVWNTQSGALAENGWSYGIPRLSISRADNVAPNGSLGPFCSLLTNFVFTDPEDQPHSLNLSVSFPNVNPPCTNYFPNQLAGGEGPISATVSASGAATNVTTADGTTYNFDGSEIADSVTDRNGNQVTISQDPNTGDITYTDTLGRQALATSGFDGGNNTVAVSGGGAYALTWGTASASFAVTATLLDESSGSTCNTTIAASGSNPVVASLTTPEGTYQFQYDPTFGLLSKVIYPGGGYVRYVWGLTSGPSEAGFFQANSGGGDWIGPAAECSLRYATPVVTDRYVSSDGATEQQWQHFDYSTAWNGSDPHYWSSKQTVVTTHDQVAGTSFATTYTYSGIYGVMQPNSTLEVSTEMPVEQQVVSQDVGGAVLRTVDEQWTAWPILPTSRTTILPNDQQKETTIAYSAAMEPIEQDDYDYGAGAPPAAPARKTLTTYASLGASGIVDRPASVVVEDGGGNRVAEADYGYDETTPQATSGIVQHAAVAGSRGNLTSVHRWVNTTGAFLVSTFAYDDTGQRLSATDAAGDTTSYSYADNFVGGAPYTTNAYITTIADALGHADRYAWNYAGGTMASHADQNTNTSNYLYNDAWGRLTEADFPDGGVTTYTYSPNSTTLETKRKQDTAGDWMDELDSFDGLGRPIVAATETSANQWSRVDTLYNGYGEKSHVTYPYSSASSGAPANNSEPGDSLQYDALGRQTLDTHADGATFITTYADRDTETQDEGDGTDRITRISQVDGLGRLSRVCEVISGTGPSQGNTGADCSGLDVAANGYLTSYGYNTQNDLASVTQGGESRTFGYDSLSRLLSASNSELAGGSYSYVYDADSNCAAPNRSAGDLASRTDARGIRTCYQYDGLHRLTQVNYSDGTPTAFFSYDQNSLWGTSLTNPVGRLTEEWTSSNTAEIFSYDPMGRTAYTATATPGVFGSGSFPQSYTYDLAGDPLTSDYMRRSTLTSVFDLAGRPTSLTSSADGTLISNVAYDAWGHELSATLGNGITETRGYDLRGRLDALTAVTGQSWVPGTPGTGWISVGGSEQSKVLPRGCTEATCQTVYDSGNVWANVGTASANYGYGQGDDSTTVASGLAAQLNGNVVHATASGSTVNLTAAASGSNTDYAISVGSNTTEGDFGHPSFTATASGATLTGGANGYYSGGNTVYSLGGITYAGDNDMLAATDSANGAYSFSYNDLNQLAQACTPSCSGTVDAYTYDRYGNRWTGPGSSLTFNNSYNRMDGASYDANGNLTSSNGQTLQYDAENRLVGVNGGATASYVYDAEGRRVHESVGGVVKEYIYAQDGQELSVVDASQNLLQGETYFGGRTLATVGSAGTSYAHTDWLGTVRARTGPAGALAGAYTSGPFGENLSAIGGASSLHLTGKYRDGETGFDYFGARYYNSSLGRFLTPDWSQAPAAVPYANLANPQSLNLYSYVLNNPGTSTDANGHYSDLVFDGATHTITLLDRNGNVIGRWPAADNVDSRATIGKLVDGTYQFFDTTSPHLHGGSADTAHGAFGPDGIFRLKEFRGADGKEHVGVGVHAGKEGVPDGLNRTGPEHATMGCLRTCGAATGAIRQLITSDPLETLRVINNRRLKMCKEGTPCGGPAPKTTSPTKPLPDAGGGQLLLLVTYHPPLQRKRPENYRAERTLSGVTVGSTTVAQVIAALGPPENVEEKSGPDFPKGSGSRAYTWTRGHVIMQVAADFYRDSAGRRIESAVQSVQVWGHEANGQIGMTGRGIALGSQISSAQRVYGRDCSSGKYKHGNGNQNTHGFLYVYYLEYPRANYEQENGALFIDADAHGRIVHMSVIGPV